MLSHPALCCRKETYSSASSDCSTDSKKRSQSLNSLDIQSRCQDAQSRTFAGWGWGASATGRHPQLVGICNWRASTTVKKQRSPRNGARLGRARGIDTWNSGLIVGKHRWGGSLSVLLFEEDVHKRASKALVCNKYLITTQGDGRKATRTQRHQSTSVHSARP